MPTPLFTPSETVQSSYRILVADDNDAFRAAIHGLLRRLGHSVELATNGLEAVEAASRETFDFVFLDIQMPEMGGFEAASVLRQGNIETPPTRIIGLSAQGDHAGDPAMASMDDFLVKPIRLFDLVQVLGQPIHS